MNDRYDPNSFQDDEMMHLSDCSDMEYDAHPYQGDLIDSYTLSEEHLPS